MFKNLGNCLVIWDQTGSMVLINGCPLPELYPTKMVSSTFCSIFSSHDPLGPAREISTEFHWKGRSVELHRENTINFHKSSNIIFENFPHKSVEFLGETPQKSIKFYGALWIYFRGVLERKICGSPLGKLHKVPIIKHNSPEFSI